jgi:hypothetical protein
MTESGLRIVISKRKIGMEWLGSFCGDTRGNQRNPSGAKGEKLGVKIGELLVEGDPSAREKGVGTKKDKPEGVEGRIRRTGTMSNLYKVKEVSRR